MAQKLTSEMSIIILQDTALGFELHKEFEIFKKKETRSSQILGIHKYRTFQHDLSTH